MKSSQKEKKRKQQQQKKTKKTQKPISVKHNETRCDYISLWRSVTLRKEREGERDRQLEGYGNHGGCGFQGFFFFFLHGI